MSALHPTLMLNIVLVGLFGTLVFDLWNRAAFHLFGIRAPNWAILGRWVLIPSTLHDGSAIALGAFSPTERVIGSVLHQATGILFAALLIAWQGSGWLVRPTVLPAVQLGLLTLFFSWFMISPALGHGVAARKLPSATGFRLSGVLSHGLMGFGYFLGAVLLHQLKIV